MRKYKYDLTYNGKTYPTVKAASDDLGLTTSNLRYRLRASELSLSVAMSKDWSRFGTQKERIIYTYGDRTFKSIFEVAEEYNFAYTMLKRLLINNSLQEIIDNKMIGKKGSRRK